MGESMRNITRKKGRTFLILFLILALLSCTWGCGKKAETGKIRVAVITKSTTSAFWKSAYAGVRAASTEYNTSITFEGPDSEDDYETQNRMVREAIEDGADAIVFSAVDYDNNADAIDQAAQQGIKVIIIDSDVNSTGVSCRIGTDNYEAGCMAGQAALESDAEELYVGIVNYGINSANGQQREEGCRDTLGQDARVKEITTINVLSTMEDSREGAKKLLLSNPEINVVVTFNEWTSLGVGWAIRDLNLADSVHVVAFDSNVVSVGMLETGEVDALIVQNPFAMGYLGIETAVKLVNGQSNIPTEVDTSTTIITKENMYEPESQKIMFPFNENKQ